MKTYRAIAAMTIYLAADIEAENLEQAEEIAQSMDGGSFERLRGRFDELGDWCITDVSEVTA